MPPSPSFSRCQTKLEKITRIVPKTLSMSREKKAGIGAHSAGHKRRKRSNSGGSRRKLASRKTGRDVTARPSRADDGEVAETESSCNNVTNTRVSYFNSVFHVEYFVSHVGRIDCHTITVIWEFSSDLRLGCQSPYLFLTTRLSAELTYFASSPLSATTS